MTIDSKVLLRFQDVARELQDKHGFNGDLRREIIHELISVYHACRLTNEMQPAPLPKQTIPFTCDPIEARRLIREAMFDSEEQNRTVLMRVQPTNIETKSHPLTSEIIGKLECYIVDVFEDDGRETA